MGGLGASLSVPTYVRLIFELAQDGYTANEIVRALFERGIPTPAEYKAAHGHNGHDISRCCGIWHETSVAHILGDERYTGTYIIGKREVTEVGGHRVRMKDERKFISVVKKYTDMTQLDATILREFVKQIRVSDTYTTEPRAAKVGKNP